ncbi:MAG: PfkB family carbohydrate kinase [Chloroflexota bacterium]|nr:PfkB family carbohydrate kinase [Chloroflexota bacterium]
MTEMLIVGGLTIDRFTDGSVAPGGSVLHAGLAGHSEGARLTMVTVAGGEPAALDGLARLRDLGGLAHQPAATTTAYRHEERDGLRVLVLQARSSPIESSGLEHLNPPDVALVAPIADEVSAQLVDALAATLRPRWTVLLIQGWLRRLVEGEEVVPLGLDVLSADQRRVIAGADAIVVSTEDLVEAPGDPFTQAAELRQLAGSGPIVVLTLGTEGYLLDDADQDRVVASVPRRIVSGVSAVGAGDTFGAGLAVNLARGATPLTAADLATDRVISVLESRRPAWRT